MESQEKAAAGHFVRGLSRIKSSVKESECRVLNLWKSLKKLGEDDPRRIIHSIKVALALTLVSLLYYIRPFYDGYGISGMWAVLTVVVVFEFTAGGTLSRCVNRGCATFAAAALGVGAQHLASVFSKAAQPVVTGLLVFLLAAAATFTRFFPRIKARYDYGVLIFIMTFTMVSISGYRVENLVEFAHQRLSTILIGGAICVVISTCVCPVWAGEDLHNLIALHMEKLAIFLEGFGSEFFDCEKGATSSFKDDKIAVRGYKGILISKNTEEILANFARWEPGHGRFRFRHPWKCYLKIGSLARRCAYQLEALNGYLNSDIQAPPAFKKKIEESCIKISFESSRALKIFSVSIKSMDDPSPSKIHIENSIVAVKELETALRAMPFEDSLDLLTIVPGAAVASILTQVANCVQDISEAVCDLSQVARFKGTLKSSLLQGHTPKPLHPASVPPVVDVEESKITVVVVQDQAVNSS